LAVFLAHHLDADGVFNLPDLLSSSPTVRTADNAIFELGRYVGPPTWAWSRNSPPSSSPSQIRETWARKEAPLLNAGSFSFVVGPRMIEATHLLKLSRFAKDDEAIQVPIRRLCRALAHELGGNRSVYLPDSAYRVSALLDLVYDGVSFDEMSSRLKEFGPPATTIRAICEAGNHEFERYYIDDFGDLDA